MVLHADPATETSIITTQILPKADGFDIRRDFCGVQDERLNSLRHFTDCIIDLQTYGTKDPFEKVVWTISHYDPRVRTFAVNRIQTWAQITQLAVQMHLEDIAFHQNFTADTSSSSTDAKVQQCGNSVKSSPSPPRNAVPKMFIKNSKTPLHDHYYGSALNAALVPQTDVRSRYQQRPRRNSSSSSSEIQRPAFFGKPSDHFLSRRSEYERSRYSPLSTPMSKVKSNDTGLYLPKPPHAQMEEEYSLEIDQKLIGKQSTSNDEFDTTDYDEESSWANLLSDQSDGEGHCRPLMGDIILVSQLRDCLVHADISLISSIETIQSRIHVPLSITSVEKTRILNHRQVWTHRLLLNSKIILANGIHTCKEQAQKLAYRKMVELMTSKQGVEPIIISDGRCKVVLRKALPPKQFNETTLDDTILNSTIDAH